MKVFAIGDLHLPGGDKKPMDVFGPHWERHFERICEDWRARVTPEDLVLIPGDISWAMQLSAAREDLLSIAALPGTTLILRGNPDYWWASLTQLRDLLPANMHAVQNDAYDAGTCVICGTRGWTIPPANGADAQDEKIYRREALRLGLSLDAAQRIARGRPIVAMLHYPPFNERQEDSAFTALFEKYGVQRVVYGHLHGPGTRYAFNGTRNGVSYQLTSSDAIDFSPRLIFET